MMVPILCVPPSSSALPCEFCAQRDIDGRGLNTSSPNPTALGFLRVTMLSLSLTALGLVTIDAYAKDAIGAVGGLEVSPSTSTHKIVSKSELRVVTTVKSVGDGGLKIFKFKTPTRSFTVNKSGNKVPFTGVKVCAYLPHRVFPSPPDLLCDLLVDIQIDGSHRFRFLWIATPGMTGLSSPPARTSTMVSF